MARALVFYWGSDESFRSAVPEEADMASVVIGRVWGVSEVVVPKDVPERSTVSRAHAQIFHRGDGYWVEDLQSRNFTFAEGQINPGMISDRSHF